jgi:hypothetical protein
MAQTETKFTAAFMAQQRELEQSAKGLSWVIEGAGTDYIVAAANHYPAALDEIERLRARLTEAEATLQAYAEPSNWSDTAIYEAEDWKSVNSNGCPDTYEVEACIGETVVWVGDEDGPMLASGYFKKYDEQDTAQP